MPTMTGKNCPNEAGIIATSPLAIASTIFVPEKIPANTPAAKTNRTTIKAFPECAKIRLFAFPD